MASSRDKGARFVEIQRAAFAEADPAHYLWQSTCPVIVDGEREMIRLAVEGMEGRLLEVGCGEGANLLHLPESVAAHGVDRSLPKACFAARANPNAHFVAADGAALPFPDAGFDALLLRDTLHHVPDPLALLRECCRVLRPQGRLSIVEPCARNPIILLQAIVARAERAVLGRNRDQLEREIAAMPLELLDVRHAQPLPLSRIFFHYRFGLPGLARLRIGRGAVGALEAAGRIIPRKAWAYQILRCRRART